MEGKIVAQAIYQVISPLLEKKFSRNSYACIRGRGQHMCAEETQRVFFNFHSDFYVYKGDIKGYFKSVKKRRLRQILYKFFKDKNLRKLLCIFIAAYKEDGIPIGWLTSEIFANIYLHKMDMYIAKNFSNVKYKRFMDDFIIISTNKEELVECIKSVGKFLNINLLLIENPKSKIYKNHVDFCGYVIFAGYKKCRQRIFYSAFRRYKKYIMYGEFEKLFQSIPSLFGYAKFCMCRTKLVNLIYRLFSNLYIIPHTTKEEYYIKFLKDIKVKDQLTHEKEVKYNGITRTNKTSRKKAA